MHQKQRHQMLRIFLAFCVSLFVLTDGASVVRIPRVYNVLIRSDGALAPSEAVSADTLEDAEKSTGKDAARETTKNARPASPDNADGLEEIDYDEEDEDEIPRKKMKEALAPPPLPILDPKGGAIQENVNYTEVPLSRAYPLTRYTAPIIATHYPLGYLTPLHGGLILGPIPRLPDAVLRTIPNPHESRFVNSRTFSPGQTRGLASEVDNESAVFEQEEGI